MAGRVARWLGVREAPGWCVDLVETNRFVLRNTSERGTADDVRLAFVDDEPARRDGDTAWAIFEPGRRSEFEVVYEWGTLPWRKRVRVTWTPNRRDDPGKWETCLPLPRVAQTK